MQSVDEFTPSTTEPVFGSGLISQTKNQTSTNNENGDHENVIPSSEPVVNGQTDATINKPSSNDNITNGTTETTNTVNLSTVHVNGQNEKTSVEENHDAQPVEEPMVTENPTPVEPTVSSTEPEPVSSTPNEGTSTTTDTAPPAVVEPTPTTNETASEAPVSMETETTEVKSKSPRGKAKAPVASTPPARQSTRGRKPASSTTVEETSKTEDVSTTNQTESPQRTKRQAATAAKDAITASNEANDTNDQEMASSTDETNESSNKTASPSPGRKRAAPKSTPNAAKKGRGKNSVTSTDDAEQDVSVNEGESVQTPPKKARTSSTKKTPEPPSEDYVRKLRPRK